MIKEFFQNNPKVAIAFSGGVDSAYLLYAAIQYATEVRGYYVKSAFQPKFEMEDALRLAKDLKADIKILEIDVLSQEAITDNPSNRCYYCKKSIFSTILKAAEDDGFSVLVDGTNASDDADDRPGMLALKEMKVLSPLRECGLTKDKIRLLSKKSGLFTWDKPAYACLATRIATGEKITEKKLQNTEAAEDFLHSIGFKDFRVRMFKDCAKIQVSEDQLGLILEKRQEILKELKKYYPAVLLDLEVRNE